MVTVVPTVGEPGCPGCNSVAGLTVVTGTGWASEITEMSLSRVTVLKPGFRTKLVMPAPGLEVFANDIDGIPKLCGTKQCAAVRIVRELISEPVHCEPGIETPGTPGLNKLTTWGY